MVDNVKKKLEIITLSKKIDIIKCFESGERAVDNANHYYTNYRQNY